MSIFYITENLGLRCADSHILCTWPYYRFINAQVKISTPMVVDRSVTVGNSTYKLSGCVIHVGDRMKTDHYTCIGVHPDGQLVNYDDSCVRHIYYHTLLLCALLRLSECHREPSLTIFFSGFCWT